RNSPTGQQLHRRTSSGRGAYFFRENSLRPSMTSICSATRRLSLAFSPSSSFNRRASDTSIPPYLLRQRKNVCSVMLCLRAISRICAPEVSASRRIRMTCSSVNRFFIGKSLSVVKLQDSPQKWLQIRYSGQSLELCNKSWRRIDCPKL